MKYTFVENSWQDYLYWQNTNKQILKRINLLLKDISRSSYTGLGKPEPLKHDLTGYWSRRIDEEHRLVYKVNKDQVLIYKCRHHY